MRSALRLLRVRLVEALVVAALSMASYPEILLAFLARRPGLNLRLRPWRPGEPLPTVFAAGYLGSPSNFAVLMHRLRRHGFRSQAILWLHPFWLPCATYAARVARTVERVIAATGAPQVDLVAHSMGGLAARHYLGRLGGASRVRRLVTIATPHRVTRRALFGPGASARDLRPGSRFLADLEGDLASLPPGTVVSVRSEGDAVAPLETTAVPLPQRNVLVPGCGHGTLFFSSEALRAVVDALA